MTVPVARLKVVLNLERLTPDEPIPYRLIEIPDPAS
jgi:hypothetical protein